MTSLLNIAIALLAGLLMTRIFNLWHLPDVTAFLTAGLLIGPCCLGRLGISGLGFPTYGEVGNLVLLSNVAMGFIAFSIKGIINKGSIIKFGFSRCTLNEKSKLSSRRSFSRSAYFCKISTSSCNVIYLSFT